MLFQKLNLIVFSGLLINWVLIAGPDIGKPAPAFKLKDTQGKETSLSQFKGKFVVLEWFNHGCPFVQKHYESGNMQGLQAKYTGKGVVWLSILSSAPGKSGHGVFKPSEDALKKGQPASTAILIDETGEVGKKYGAKTTPSMFVVDPKGQLIYQGAIDDKDTTDIEDVKTAKNYVSIALDEAMAGKKVATASTTSYGCGVKYKN